MTRSLSGFVSELAADNADGLPARPLSSAPPGVACKMTRHLFRLRASLATNRAATVPNNCMSIRSFRGRNHEGSEIEKCAKSVLKRINL